MADVAMPQAPLAAPADENAAPSNVACNPLLAGACDDDDNELTEAQKSEIDSKSKSTPNPVSYTHLTLPTICSV